MWYLTCPTFVQYCRLGRLSHEVGWKYQVCLLIFSFVCVCVVCVCVCVRARVRVCLRACMRGMHVCVRCTSIESHA